MSGATFIIKGVVQMDKFTSISQVGEEELSVVCGTSYSPVSGEVQTCALYGV